MTRPATDDEHEFAALLRRMTDAQFARFIRQISEEAARAA